MLEVSIRSRNGALSRLGCVVNGHRKLRQATNEYATLRPSSYRDFLWFRRWCIVLGDFFFRVPLILRSCSRCSINVYSSRYVDVLTFIKFMLHVGGCRLRKLSDGNYYEHDNHMYTTEDGEDGEEDSVSRWLRRLPWWRRCRFVIHAILSTSKGSGDPMYGWNTLREVPVSNCCEL